MGRFKVRLQIPYEVEVSAASRQAAVAKVTKEFPNVIEEPEFEGIPTNMCQARVLWVDKLDGPEENPPEPMVA